MHDLWLIFACELSKGNTFLADRCLSWKFLIFRHGADCLSWLLLELQFIAWKQWGENLTSSDISRHLPSEKLTEIRESESWLTDGIVTKMWGAIIVKMLVTNVTWGRWGVTSTNEGPLLITISQSEERNEAEISDLMWHKLHCWQYCIIDCVWTWTKKRKRGTLFCAETSCLKCRSHLVVCVVVEQTDMYCVDTL